MTGAAESAAHDLPLGPSSEHGRLVAPEAERSVLAAMLRDWSCIVKVRERLRGEHFCAKGHRIIFEAILLSDGVDLSGLAARLRSDGTLDEVGGYETLLAILDTTPHAARVDDDASLVLQAAARRKAVADARRLERAARSGGIEEIIAARTEAGSVTSVTPSGPDRAEWMPPVPLPGMGRLPDFPIHTLPRWARCWAEAEAEAIQTPVDLSALLALGVTSAAIAKKFNVCITPGWHESLNLYVVVALPSGEGKTPVFRHATLPLMTFEREEAKRLEPQIRAASERLAYLHKRATYLRKQAAKAPEDSNTETIEKEIADVVEELGTVKVPNRPRLVADDATIEALAKLMVAHGGRMAVISAEGGPFEIMGGRYSDGVAFELYLKGYSGDYLAVDRITRTGGVVYEPILTVVLTVQPSVIAGLADKDGFRGRGLLARFAYSIPRSRVGSRDPRPACMSKEVYDNYTAHVMTLLRVPTNDNEHGEVNGHSLQVDDEARDLFFAFKAEIEPHMGPGTELEAMADWINKLPGLVLRLAGVLHMADHADDIPLAIARSIRFETMRRAIDIGRYFLAHARAAFGLMAADPMVEDARLILAFVRRRAWTTVSRRDLHRGMQSRFRRAEHLDPAIDLLTQHGFLREVPPTPRLTGGHPERRFAVNPRDAEDPDHVTLVTGPRRPDGCVTTVTASSLTEFNDEERERRAIQEADAGIEADPDARADASDSDTTAMEAAP